MAGSDPGALQELRVVEAELNERWPETKIEPSLDRIKALTDLLVVSADVAEAEARFERFTARAARATAFGRTIALDRGRIEIVSEAAFAALVPEIKVPRLPFMGAYALQVASLSAAAALLADAGLSARRAGNALIVPFPAELGTGAWLFVESSDVSLFV